MITREVKRKLRVPLRTFSFRGGLLAYLEALKVGVARLQKRLLMLLVYLESEGGLAIAFIARARNKMIDCCACFATTPTCALVQSMQTLLSSF